MHTSVYFIFCLFIQNRCEFEIHRLTAMTFSLMPPTGRTLPVSDTSPVIARFCRTGTPIAKDNKAVTMVQPALGPSFGVAPCKQKKLHLK